MESWEPQHLGDRRPRNVLSVPFWHKNDMLLEQLFSVAYREKLPWLFWFSFPFFFFLYYTLSLSLFLPSSVGCSATGKICILGNTKYYSTFDWWIHSLIFSRHSCSFHQVFLIILICIQQYLHDIYLYHNMWDTQISHIYIAISLIDAHIFLVILKKFLLPMMNIIDNWHAVISMKIV